MCAILSYDMIALFLFSDVRQCYSMRNLEFLAYYRFRLVDESKNLARATRNSDDGATDCRHWHSLLVVRVVLSILSIELLSRKMRFNIAVHVLAQTLPLVAASVVIEERKKREASVLEADAVKAALFQEVEVEVVTSEHKKEKKTAAQVSRPVTTNASSKKLSSASHADKPLVECNPDVGIFACGKSTETRCVASNESTLGGFCVTYQKARSTAFHRGLQDGGLCGDYYLQCDCTNVDANGVGSYTCTQPNECIDSAGQVCGTIEDAITVNADSSYSSSKCFVLEAGGAVENALDSPISQYCYTVVSDGTAKTQCTLEIDNVECNSCTPIDCPGDITAASLDCTNIDPLAVGNTCSGALKVLDLLAGTLTSAPTAAPTAAPVPAPTSAGTTPTAASTTPGPTEEPTSKASNLMTKTSKVSVAIALTVALVASQIVA